MVKQVSVTEVQFVAAGKLRNVRRFSYADALLFLPAALPAFPQWPVTEQLHLLIEPGALQ
jgi:hypothetical protein